MRMVVALLLCCSSLSAQEVSKGVLQLIRDASVTVEVDGEVHGSGTLFTKDDGDTYCVTAAHLFRPKDSHISVAQHRDGKKAYVFARLIAKDDERDAAILHVGRGVFKTAKLCTKKPSLDSPVVHCGSMRGLHHTVVRGYITAVDEVMDEDVPHKWDRGDFTGDYGSSGGGVFNTSGELIGYVTHGIGQRICWFVPVRHVTEFIK